MVKKLNRQEIENLMPHGEPFLFIDSAEIGIGVAKMRYKIRDDEYFFKGHFKGNPVFPGTLMFEAIGQLGVLYLLSSDDPAIEKPVDKEKIFFMSSDNARCTRICRPGETLDIDLKVSRIRRPLFFFEGKSRKRRARSVRGKGHFNIRLQILK